MADKDSNTHTYTPKHANTRTHTKPPPLALESGQRELSLQLFCEEISPAWDIFFSTFCAGCQRNAKRALPQEIMLCEGNSNNNSSNK